MNIRKKIENFSRLGDILCGYAEADSLSPDVISGMNTDAFDKCIDDAIASNAWFTAASVRKMLHALGESMNKKDLNNWAARYDFSKVTKSKTVAIVMAGNIPAVGFHDFISVLMSGHKVLAKCSSDDQYLIPGIAGLLIQMDDGFRELIEFSDGPIKNFDAVIATGSNNSARYFNEYFGAYPNIIRKNRNALAILSGKEDKRILAALGDDVFSYFGLGCRNISKVFIPEDYDVSALFEAWQGFEDIGNHSKYINNYDYNKSIFLINGDPHFDNGFLLMREGQAMSSPVSVLHYERYKDIQEVKDYVHDHDDEIQCVITEISGFPGSIAPGRGQYPKLWDYADGVDTMSFLLQLHQ